MVSTHVNLYGGLLISCSSQSRIIQTQTHIQFSFFSFLFGAHIQIFNVPMRSLWANKDQAVLCWMYWFNMSVLP